jgi:integrase
MIQAIQRPFNWAVKLGDIAANPMRYIEKPSIQRREQAVTPEEWTKIRGYYKTGDSFRDFLEVAWESGCRPQEIKAIEARHVQLKAHRAVLPKEEAKGKRKPRVIYLTPRAESIIARLKAVYPTGPLFRNTRGRKWTSWAINCRFVRLKAHLGFVGICRDSLRRATSWNSRRLTAHDIQQQQTPSLAIGRQRVAVGAEGN